MSEETTVVQEQRGGGKKPATVLVGPFTVEADHPRNCDLLLQGIPGARLRSAISASRVVLDQHTGEPKIPVDQARHLGAMPPIPGMRLHVHPKNCTYRIEDPLDSPEGAELCERIRRRLNETGMAIDKLKGVPSVEGKLDIHRMKTLCREVVWLLNEKAVRMVQGEEPLLDEVDAMPGFYLLNPGSTVANTQPIYEKDWAGWVEKLTHMGG